MTGIIDSTTEDSWQEFGETTQLQMILSGTCRAKYLGVYMQLSGTCNAKYFCVYMQLSGTCNYLGVYRQFFLIYCNSFNLCYRNACSYVSMPSIAVEIKLFFYLLICLFIYIFIYLFINVSFRNLLLWAALIKINN